YFLNRHLNLNPITIWQMYIAKIVPTQSAEISIPSISPVSFNETGYPQSYPQFRSNTVQFCICSCLIL
ncbi:MAG: hypothetical protein ABIL22_03055, partial [candidate division WOR-3 bacterium]